MRKANKAEKFQTANNSNSFDLRLCLACEILLYLWLKNVVSLCLPAFVILSIYLSLASAQQQQGPLEQICYRKRAGYPVRLVMCLSLFLSLSLSLYNRHSFRVSRTSGSIRAKECVKVCCVCVSKISEAFHSKQARELLVFQSREAKRKPLVVGLKIPQNFAFFLQLLFYSPLH